MRLEPGDKEPISASAGETDRDDELSASKRTSVQHTDISAVVDMYRTRAYGCTGGKVCWRVKVPC